MTTLAAPAVIAVLACMLALAIGLYLALSPGPARLQMERRRPGFRPGPSTLTHAATEATTLIDKVLRRRGGTDLTATLERAGVKMRVQELVLLVIAGSLVAVALGVVLGNLLLGIGLGVAVPLGAKVWLGTRIGRRRRAFADQLDESLQLMTSSLRAGHSLLQALDAVSRESEEPTASEFARVINETRVGRPLVEALDETADRVKSQDFVWVVQAIAINREIGGNLAEVLDGVGHTIRERNQIRGQVKALAAEGKLSAYVLMALPVGIVGFLSMTNPSYMGRFTQSLVGYAMIAAAVVLFVVGGLWMRKVVSFKF